VNKNLPLQSKTMHERVEYFSVTQ